MENDYKFAANENLALVDNLVNKRKLSRRS